MSTSGMATYVNGSLITNFSEIYEIKCELLPIDNVEDNNRKPLFIWNMLVAI